MSQILSRRSVRLLLGLALLLTFALPAAPASATSVTRQQGELMGPLTLVCPSGFDISITPVSGEAFTIVFRDDAGNVTKEIYRATGRAVVRNESSGYQLTLTMSSTSQVKYRPDGNYRVLTSGPRVIYDKEPVILGLPDPSYFKGSDKWDSSTDVWTYGGRAVDLCALLDH